MEDKNSIPFNQRYGFTNGRPISEDFPQSARIGLGFIISDLIERNYIVGNPAWDKVLIELYRLARIGRPNEQWYTFQDEFEWLVQKVEWYKVYIFCERIYKNLLAEVTNDELMKVVVPIEEVKTYFTNEINNLLLEENLDYRFRDGQFERAGRLQTQKSIKRMGAVLSNESLIHARTHYIKAIKFFNERPSPDVNNCVKEAICALESSLESITGKKASNNFTKVIRELQNDGIIKIPPTIAESIIKVYAFRGEGQGVAHSSTGGYVVTDVEAELVLNLVASYITYLVDLYQETKEEIPF